MTPVLYRNSFFFLGIFETFWQNRILRSWYSRLTHKNAKKSFPQILVFLRYARAFPQKFLVKCPPPPPPHGLKSLKERLPVKITRSKIKFHRISFLSFFQSMKHLVCYIFTCFTLYLLWDRKKTVEICHWVRYTVDETGPPERLEGNNIKHSAFFKTLKNLSTKLETLKEIEFGLRRDSN